jgi:hypothetical protein
VPFLPDFLPSKPFFFAVGFFERLISVLLTAGVFCFVALLVAGGLG